jgi:hypothetical protein
VSSFFDHFWTREHGMTNMLILICISNFLILPVFGQFNTMRIALNVFWMLFLLAGIFTMTDRTKLRNFLIIVPACYVVLRVILFFHFNPMLVWADFIVGVCTLLLLTSLVFIRVFEVGPVSVHRILGSIVVYLLVGNLFAVAYEFMYTYLPGAFNVDLVTTHDHLIHSNFLYFSYTTLTTTGYGDILPVHPFTRNLVVIEQIVGVLYPVILIGRLVSMKVDSPS